MTKKIDHKESIFYQYIVFFKWLLIAVVTGVIVGIAGALFHIALDMATEFRTEHSFMIFLLPFSGLVIVWLYNVCGMSGNTGTNGIIRGARGEEEVSLKTAPLIIIATALTHLTGGSAGREGAALQLGGSLVSPMKKLLKLDQRSHSMLVMCGMAAGFAALFGTPAAAAVFAIEVTVVGMTRYSAILPCLIASLTAAMTARVLHVEPTAFSVAVVPEFDGDSAVVLAKTVAMGIIGALISILFCFVMEETGELYKKYLKNPYLRALAGGAAVALISYIVFVITGSYDYNGAGTDVIRRAFEGESRPEAFLLKILFTALTLGAGFKGGEIVPSLFTGAAAGCFFGGLVGLHPSFGAALGAAAVFCGVTNCPFASLILAVELFGADGLPYYALVVGMSYMLSGFTGLYSAQKFYDGKFADGKIEKPLTYDEIKSNSAISEGDE